LAASRRWDRCRAGHCLVDNYWCLFPRQWIGTLVARVRRGLYRAPGPHRGRPMTPNMSEIQVQAFFSRRNVEAVNRFLMVTTAICCGCQWLANWDTLNFICCSLCAMGVIGTCLIVSRSDNYLRFPVSTGNVVVSSVGYLYVPLLWSTAAGLKPIYHDLKMPIEVFGYSLGVNVATAFAHFLYMRSTPVLRLRMAVTGIMDKLGVFQDVPEAVIVLIGLVGTVFYLIFAMGAKSGEHASQGGVLKSFATQLRPLAYLPICLLFNFPRSPYPAVRRRRVFMVFAYIAVFGVVAMGVNSRGALTDPVLDILLCFGLCSLTGQIRILRPHRKYVLYGVAVGIVAFAGFSRVSEAILAVRQYRGSVSGAKLMELTLSQLQKPSVLKENLGQGSYNYSENYYGVEVLNRLDNPKIMDNGFVMTQGMSPQAIHSLAEFEIGRIITQLPTPMLQLIGYKGDKDYLQTRDVGDLYRHYYTGETYSSFLLSSFVVDGNLFFGFLFLPVIATIYYLIFPLLDSFSRSETTREDLIAGRKLGWTPMRPFFPAMFFPLANFIVYYIFPKDAMLVFFACFRDIGEPILAYLVFAKLIQFVLNLLKMPKRPELVRAS